MLDYLVCELLLNERIPKRVSRSWYMGMAVLYCKCLFLVLDLLHWSKRFLEGHLMGVSPCSVLDD